MLTVWKLRRERRCLVAKAEEESRREDEAKNYPKAMQIGAECFLACQSIDDRLSRILDQAIRQEAQELDVAFPSVGDAEMWNRDDEGLRLSFRGRFYLRAQIDAEKARRFEVKTLWVTKFWLPLLAAGVGIIGALTGLVAVLQHKK